MADPDSEVEDLRPALNELTHDLSGDDLPRQHWPIYGSLLTSLLNVVAIVDDVASHREQLRPRPADGPERGGGEVL